MEPGPSEPGPSGAIEFGAGVPQSVAAQYELVNDLFAAAPDGPGSDLAVTRVRVVSDGLGLAPSDLRPRPLC